MYENKYFLNEISCSLNFLVTQLPNHDKWLHSRRSSSVLLDFFQYACCCQRRNRVTTDTI
jgi:hypothetical protein